jgi:CMP-N,N'-diacetyllegionaminic acid synthase
MNVVALISARGGSKGVPKKNIRNLAGYPLIGYSVTACTLAKKINRTIISTDCPEIAEIAVGYGAEAPFLRPAELAQDKSGDIEFVQHFLDWTQENEKEQPDYLVHIRPTTPLRDPSLIDQAIETLIANPEATGLRSAHEISEPVEKFFRIQPNGIFEGIFPDHPVPEYYNLPRQTFLPCYHPNGYVDVISVKNVRETGKLHGSKILAFITPRSVEIDSPEDFELLEYLSAKEESPLFKEMRNKFPK